MLNEIPIKTRLWSLKYATQYLLVKKVLEVMFNILKKI